jgi:hypothetical protein
MNMSEKDMVSNLLIVDYFLSIVLEVYMTSLSNSLYQIS